MTSSISFSGPYPGLRPFEFHEAPLFYGREKHIVGMLDILQQNHFLAVVGSSGCGKSSLVRAGLRPALNQRYLGERDAEWHFVILKPGSDPFESLARAVVETSQSDGQDPSARPVDPDDVAFCMRELRRGPQGLLDAIDGFLPGKQTHVLVLVDQFEEIFRFTHRDRDAVSHDQEVDPEGLDDAIAFVDLLLSTAGMKHPRVYVALTMRSDFLGDCDAFRDLPEAINRSQFLPPRLSREELRDAIERPPQNPQFDGPPDEHGITTKSGIEPEVVSELLAAMGDRQDQLPLIQHALMRMWSVAAGADNVRPAQIDVDVMRRCGMQDSSSVAGALDQHVELIYRGLGDDSRKEIARRMFCALCLQGGDGRRVRRVCTVAEIAAMAGEDVTDREVIDVAAEFTASGRNFLTATPQDELTAASNLDISHESLIRNWQRLGDWLDTEEESAARYRRLADSARLHIEEREEPLAGRALEAATEWFQRERPNAAWGERYAPCAFDQVERFLNLSQQREQERQDAAQREEREKAEAKERELQLARELADAQTKKAAIFRRMLIAAGLATALAVILAVVALIARREAKIQAKEAETARKEVATAFRRLETESTHGKAAALMAGLSGTSGRPTENEYESLRLLADSDSATREAFMTQLLSEPGKAHRLRPLYPHLLHAFVGLDVKEKEDVKARLSFCDAILSGYKGNPSDKRALYVAVAELGVLLAGDDSDFDKMVAINFLAAMEKTTDSTALSDLGRGLGSLGERLPGERALTLAQRILAAMEKAINSPTLYSLRDALGGLCEKLPEEQTWTLAQQILGAKEKTIDISTLHNSLGDEFASLSEKLPGQQALTLARQILAAMEEPTDVSTFLDLDDAFPRLCERLPGEQAWALAPQILAAMEKTTDSSTFSSLGDALVSLCEKLPEEQAWALARQIVAAMEKTTDSDALSHLAAALGSLGEKLPGEQALAGAQQIVAAMEMTTDLSTLSRLGAALGSLGEELPGEQALAGAQQIVAAAEKPTDYIYLINFGDALVSLCEKLPEEQALAGAQRIVAAMEKTTDSHTLVSLGAALGSLGAKLPGEQALAGAERIVTAMGKTTDSDALSSLGAALGSLGEELPGEQALALAQQIVAAMEKTTDLSTLSSLGAALGSLGEELPGELALAGAQRIVAAVEKPTDPIHLIDFGDALVSLCEELPEEKTLALARQIVAAMEMTTDLSTLSRLGAALGSLGERLPEEQALALVQQIVASMEETPDSDALSSLGGALGSLGEKLPEEQALAGAEQIVAAMEKTTDSYALSSLGQSLGALTVRLQPKDTGSVLKSIVCVGNTREKVLEALEKKAGQEFDGNLWKAVKWLEEQGVDVKNVPRFPIISPE